jgi:CheY-like chemotaxis protein
VSSQAYKETQQRGVGASSTRTKRIADKIDHRQLRVLVAEDHDDTREALRLLLEMQGYEVVAARDGQEALALAVETKPDVVITDYDMPRMDGAHLARELRSQASRFDQMPILVLTALNQAMAEHAMVAGADAYIPKPVDFMTLQATLSNYVRR